MYVFIKKMNWTGKCKSTKNTIQLGLSILIKSSKFCRFRQDFLQLSLLKLFFQYEIYAQKENNYGTLNHSSCYESHLTEK